MLAVALGEIQRVLREGGELRFYEHVISHKPRIARVQRILDATIYPPLAGGCHCAHDTGAAIRHAGLEIERQERIAFKPGPLTPAIDAHRWARAAAVAERSLAISGTSAARRPIGGRP